MSDTIISVENLGKCYRIRHQMERQRYKALRDVMADKVKNLFRHGKEKSQNSVEDFWALRNVSFEVKRGEVIGIIGRNGAGKSTLLKILSRITEPSEGRVRIRGRVASLLEVGTGFHPELTGRENIFLNGAILGMSRAEIARKFDEIVAFAEVEKFLDTPVKRYSSGMYVRLAFAVAAHLEPEILIVDEVLAVGDAEFQKKCLGKMREVSTNSGRTVLFVSHNMAAVRHLCKKGVCLERGAVRHIGEIAQTIESYLAGGDLAASLSGKTIRANGLELSDLMLCSPGSDSPLSSAVFGESYELRFKIKGSTGGARLGPFLRILDDTGTLVSSICGMEEGFDPMLIEGTSEWIISLPRLPLFPGRYSVSLQFFGSEGGPLLEALDALTFHVESALIQGASRPYRSDHGLVRICGGLEVKKVSA